jgi:uncharacterized protein (DUF2147 family)
MKRFYSLATLMLLTTSAHAGTLYSFEVAGRTININAPNGCASLQCISVSRTGDRDTVPRRVSSAKSIGKNVPRSQSRRRPDQTAEQPSRISPKSLSSAETPSSPKQATIPPQQTQAALTQVPVQTSPIVAASPALAAGPSLPAAAPAIPTSSPSTTTLADTKSGDPASPPVTDEASSRPRRALAIGFDTQLAVSAPKPTRQAASSDTTPPALSYYAAAPPPSPASASLAKASVSVDQPEKQLNASPGTGAAILTATAQSFTALAPNVPAKPLVEASSDHDRSASPLGNWRTEANKPPIRIKPCGPNLCGYASSSSANQTDEKMLIDLKPISPTEWVGMILNQDSKITYPAIVMLEDDNSLRVRSCGLSAAFCAGQVWSREAPVLAVR